MNVAFWNLGKKWLMIELATSENLVENIREVLPLVGNTKDIVIVLVFSFVVLSL